MAASKQASTYINTLPQCSPASVGLAQARPNSCGCLYSWGANKHILWYGAVVAEIYIRPTVSLPC